MYSLLMTNGSLSPNSRIKTNKKIYYCVSPSPHPQLVTADGCRSLSLVLPDVKREFLLPAVPTVKHLLNKKHLGESCDLALYA